MSDLSALLKRVEAATGPDRELDAAIHVALSRTIATDATLISRLQDWLMTQPNMQARVSEAASHFGVETERTSDE